MAGSYPGGDQREQKENVDIIQEVMLIFYQVGAWRQSVSGQRTPLRVGPPMRKHASGASVLASVIASHAGPATRRLSMNASPLRGISNHDRFMFDLNGFLVLRGVLSADEVAAANAAIDAHAAGLIARDAAPLRNAMKASPHSATGPRMDMGGMLAWPRPDCEVFRKVLVHPRIVPYVSALCGPGYRLDHQPLVIAQNTDSEGFSLHGGPISGDDGQPEGKFNPELQYRCVNSELWTSLLAVSVQLCDHRSGDGGFCIVRGSHKLNFPVPQDVANGVAPGFEDHLYQPVTKAGDVLIWSEATVHGATPWRGEHQRRIALYRFAPANMGYGRGYLEIDPNTYQDMKPLERAVVEPPYASRLERPIVTEEVALNDPEGPAPVKVRSADKKQFDRHLFGTNYF